MPKGQEKLKKWQKSGKKRGFWKKVKKFDKIKKKSDFVSLNYKIPYFPKPSNGKRLLKILLKSEKINKII